MTQKRTYPRDANGVTLRAWRRAHLFPSPPHGYRIKASASIPTSGETWRDVYERRGITLRLIEPGGAVVGVTNSRGQLERMIEDLAPGQPGQLEIPAADQGEASAAPPAPRRDSRAALKIQGWALRGAKALASAVRALESEARGHEVLAAQLRDDARAMRQRLDAIREIADELEFYHPGISGEVEL